MILQYDLDKLNTVLENFFLATGVNIDLFNENFEQVRKNKCQIPPEYCYAIQSQTRKRRPCKHSDMTLLKQCQKQKKLVMHRCHAGLIDIAVPIMFENFILGYIIFGQLKTEMDFSKIQEKIAALHLDMTKMKQYYDKLTLFDDKKIHSIACIAEILVQHIITEGMLKPCLFSKIEHVTQYIHEHLHEKITIKQLCDETHLSTSILYKKFYNHFGCTVNDYINTKRIEKSLDLLKKTDLSIEEISERIGFSAASYYSRIFKLKMGMPPNQYRQESLSEQNKTKNNREIF